MRQQPRFDLTFAMATFLAFTALSVGLASALNAATASALAKNPIFGRWQQTHTCNGLVHAFEKAHLRRVAPGWVASDYFPAKTGQQIASREHICWGAKPQRHSHFFTRDGHFGSVDQHNQQVDNGRYGILDGRTFRIIDARFRYDVARLFDHKTLALKPVITKRMRRQALADPFEFSIAGWEVAVAYTGTTWKRVPCGRWC
jgi:hypothetical protein